MYKIVETDNHGGDYPEKFVNLPDFEYEYQAYRVAEAINEIHYNSNNSTRFWKVVPDDYVLQPGFES